MYFKVSEVPKPKHLYLIIYFLKYKEAMSGKEKNRKKTTSEPILKT